jgi:hypothetical protein
LKVKLQGKGKVICEQAQHFWEFKSKLNLLLAQTQKDDLNHFANLARFLEKKWVWSTRREATALCKPDEKSVTEIWITLFWFHRLQIGISVLAWSISVWYCKFKQINCHPSVFGQTRVWRWFACSSQSETLESLAEFFSHRDVGIHSDWQGSPNFEIGHFDIIVYVWINVGVWIDVLYDKIHQVKIQISNCWCQFRGGAGMCIEFRYSANISATCQTKGLSNFALNFLIFSIWTTCFIICVWGSCNWVVKMYMFWINLFKQCVIFFLIFDWAT